MFAEKATLWLFLFLGWTKSFKNEDRLLAKSLTDKYDSFLEKEKAFLEQAEKMRLRRVRLAGPAKNKLSSAFEKALTKFVDKYVEDIIHSKISSPDLERAFLVALYTIICNDHESSLVEDGDKKSDAKISDLKSSETSE